MSGYFGLEVDGYYHESPIEDSFINSYERNWDKVMNAGFFPSESLDMGHKFRPRLVLWGGMLANARPSDDDYDELGKVAVSIELIHKASLLIDDYIDKDIARHARPTFYLQYGVEKTIIYALNLLSVAFGMMNRVFYKKNNITNYFNSMLSIIETLESMTIGALNELSLGEISTHSKESVKEIMLLETAELISSSIVTGYSLLGGENKKMVKLLETIGRKFGFIFQVFNDMEPFLETSHQHKGVLNIDITHQRKNYCVAVINEIATRRELAALDRCDLKDLQTRVFRLWDKYGVEALLVRECEDIMHAVMEDINGSMADTKWKTDFTMFLESVYDVGYNRLRNGN